MDIKWEEPPAHAIVGPGQQRGKYAEVATALRENPGRWAILPSPTGERTEKGAVATAQNIRRGKVKGFEENAFETAVDGKTVYVRFKPKDDATGESSDEPEGDPEDDDDHAVIVDPPSRPAQIRIWARANGMEIPDKGRIPRHVEEKWAEATGNELSLRAVR